MLGHYLMFNRNCAEAHKTYEEAFGAKTMEVMKYGQMPPNPNFPVPESDKGLILHSRIQIGDTIVMCADSVAGRTAGNNMYMNVTLKNEADARKAWDVLQQGGEVFMELAPSFFAPLHGSLQDKYGINWMFTIMAD